ncbi:MAG TPA: hypothetical protein VL117_10220 [Thermoleophilia bacterium]|nr:hypothetical protein [Thermoleophilia bacterium]
MSADVLARLRAADPAIGMPPEGVDDRERLRRAIVAAPLDSLARSQRRPVRPRWALVAGLALAIILLTAAAVWARTVLLAPSPLRESAPGWRQVPLDAAWKAALADHVVALSRRVSLVPLACGDDGRTFFAALSSKGYSGVVRVDAVTSRVTGIRRFAHPRTDQAWGAGAFDGRWLVWGESHTLEDPTISTVWSWDSRTGKVREIGVPGRAFASRFWAGSEPVVRDGLVTWTQAVNAAGLGAVHVIDLATGRDRIVHRGKVTESFFVAGGLVVWGRATEPAGIAVTGAADARTGARVALPAALAGARAADDLATDETAVAYAGSHLDTLWWSPSLQTPPRRLFNVVQPYPIDDSIQVAGRYISFSVAPHSYLADTRSRRYAEISAGGWTLLGTSSLVIVEPAAGKAVHPISDVVFLPLRSLPAMPAGT